MNSQMIDTSFKHEDLVKELLSDIDQNLDSDLDPDQCCIYKVPKEIRRINEEVYTPQLISIGPLHHGKKELTRMEKKKRRYMKSFLGRITLEKRDEILSFIENNERNIRNCYNETSELVSLKYVMMILYDAIFIIELFIRHITRDRSDLLLVITTVRLTLSKDLELLENQLPYFVLEEIHNSAFVGSNLLTFTELSCSFFSFFQDLDLIRLTPPLVVKHFTDWRRSTLLGTYPSSRQSNGMVEDLPCAVKLHESGVMFKRMEGGHNLFDIRFEKRKQECQIPHLRIYDDTEGLFRNVMALEQCHYPKDTHVCNYVRVMDYLIDTEEDVELLIRNRIITNRIGDNASIANMFNKLNQFNSLSFSSYYDICEELKEHYNNPWNRTKAMLRRVYFNNLWKGTATVAAIILLLLTIIQTICSILQVVFM